MKSDIKPARGISFPKDLSEEYDQPETIESIKEALQTDGHEVYLLGGDLAIIEKIKRHAVEFVFNMAEGFYGRNREAMIPALLELLSVPYSGSDPTALSATLDKSIAKRIALSLGIQTPEFWVLDAISDLAQVSGRFPLFAKPLWEGSSIGILNSSRVENQIQLEREAKRLFEHYPEEPVLVETYISGREFTVAVIGNKQPEVFGIMEISFSDSKSRDFCYTLEVKRNWKETVNYYVPPNLSENEKKTLEDHALKLFRTLRLRDVARFDFRMGTNGKFYFLEVNPLPGLSPESGDIVILAGKMGLSYRELILKIVNAAFERYPNLSQLKKNKVK